MQVGNWIPNDKGKVCSMHFDIDDYRETSKSNFNKFSCVISQLPIMPLLFLDKKLLKPTAVPSLNLALFNLDEVEVSDRSITLNLEHGRLQQVLKEADSQVESRKRISNIIVVDLTKDKRAKYPERPKVS